MIISVPVIFGHLDVVFWKWSQDVNPGVVWSKQLMEQIKMPRSNLVKFLTKEVTIFHSILTIFFSDSSNTKKSQHAMFKFYSTLFVNRSKIEIHGQRTFIPSIFKSELEKSLFGKTKKTRASPETIAVSSTKTSTKSQPSSQTNGIIIIIQ